MRRALWSALVLSIALAQGPTVGAGEDDLREAHRRVLVAALRQRDVHHALSVRRIESDGNREYHAECFVEGERAGVVVLAASQGAESIALLVVTDGSRLLKRGGDGGRAVAASKKQVEASVAHWKSAREKLMAHYPTMPTRQLTLQLGMHLEDDEGVATLSAGLSFGYVRADEATVFEWTERSVWHGSRSATYAENGTRVTVTWPDFEMTFDLERGLPTSARVPKTSTGGRVEARTVAPRWTADTWRERIRSEFEVGKDLAPDPAAWRQALRGGFLADLLRDVLPQVPPAERTRETMKRLASTIVVPLAASGASGSTHAWEPDGSSEGGALRAGAAASTQARYAGWNEVASFEFGLLVREAYLAARDRLPPLPK